MQQVLERQYEPRGTARQLFGDRSPEVLLSGPAGTGKSRACLEKLHLICLLTPNVRALIIRKTFTSLRSSVLVEYENRVADVSLSKAHVVKRVEAPQYRYTNGSSITLGGMDNATRIMSSQYDIIYVNEAIELAENDWEALTTRLRNGAIGFQQLIADTNPSSPTHWLKRRCDEGKTVMLNSVHEENPVYFTEDGVLTELGADYIAKLDGLTGVRYQRLRRGLWIAAEGLIYDTWNPAVHVVPRFEIPSEWTRWWAVDFGYTNPFVCQQWAEDPDGKLYLYREIYQTAKTVDVHARRLLSIVTRDGVWREPKPRAIICDHDAEGRAQLEREVGLSTVAANKRVLEGIQAVQQRITADRLFIFADALLDRDPNLEDQKKPACTSEELPGYVWDTGAGKSPKEQPLKADDHGCDAMRYLVMQIDQGPRTRLRYL